MRGVTGMAGVWGIQHTLARRHSTAAHGLGHGAKGNRRQVIGAGGSVVTIVVFVIAQTVKAATVVRGRFMQMHRLWFSVTCSGTVFAEAVGLVESALAPGGMELPLPRSVAHPTEPHVRSFGSLLFD
jgi:hypothetical protein